MSCHRKTQAWHSINYMFSQPFGQLSNINSFCLTSSNQSAIRKHTSLCTGDLRRKTIAAWRLSYSMAYCTGWGWGGGGLFPVCWSLGFFNQTAMSTYFWSSIVLDMHPGLGNLYIPKYSGQICYSAKCKTASFWILPLCTFSNQTFISIVAAHILYILYYIVLSIKIFLAQLRD